MNVFEITTPDGRKVRHKATNLAAAKAPLIAGYAVTGIVYGAADDMSGGYVAPAEGKSLMALLLEHHGDELKAWLIANMPSFGRRNG
jgi:hypothetical protein